MGLPLATPGKCCGHNLNHHEGVEGVCIVCTCVGFEPETPDFCVNCEHPGEFHYPGGGCSVSRCDCPWEHDPQTKRPRPTGEALPGELITAATIRDSQVGGDHYRKYKIQPWDLWEEYSLDAFTGAILKYLLRDKGNRLEDLKKARHTLDKLIEIEGKKNGTQPG